MIKSALLDSIPGIAYGFGTIREPIAPALQPYSQNSASWKQVHGTAVCRVDSKGQSCGDVDALYTRVAHIPAAVRTADCVPILLARRDGGAVAAVHGGWRGTRARILAKLWQRLSEEGEKPSHWVGVVGPAIGACCYEVSEELVADFSAGFAEYGMGLLFPSPRQLDLPALNERELVELGLGAVERLDYCTRCHRVEGEAVFHSHRRYVAESAPEGRQSSGLVITG